MHNLAILFAFILLLLNLWGGALATALGLRNRWLAWAAAPWIWCTLLFSIESLAGLGQLQWLMLLTSAASAGLIALSAGVGLATGPQVLLRMQKRLSEDFSPRKMLPCLVVFSVAFAWGLFWRLGFPKIDGASEKIPDLAFICSYLTGERVPVTDAWMAPYKSTQYYSFQHYAGAMVGRMFGFGPGWTYNIAFCVMVALNATAFYGATTILARRKVVSIFLTCAFMVGGNGTSGFVHLFYKSPDLWSGARFIGSRPYDSIPVGTSMQTYANQFQRMEIAVEPMSYMVFLGDYHPPFSGFYVLSLSVLAAGMWQITRRRRYVFLVGCTFIWMILANTWTFPLLVLAAGTWLLWNVRAWRSWLVPLIGGAVAIWLLASAYLHPFVLGSLDYKTSIKVVPWDAHSPPILLILCLLPTIGITVLAVFSRCSIAVWAGIAGSVALLLPEMFYVDDIYSGMYERFNTTLKWWPWVTAAVFLTAAPALLERSPRRWIRIAGWIFVIYPLVYLFDLSAHWLRSPKESFGQLHGAHHLMTSDHTRAVINRLRVEPRGIAVERPSNESYTNSGSVALFAGHLLWLGWVGHEQLWRGYAGEVQYRHDRLVRFYSGDLSDGASWLAAEGIDYILWHHEQDTNEVRDVINNEISGDYLWCEILITHDGRKSGFWRLRKR